MSADPVRQENDWKSIADPENDIEELLTKLHLKSDRKRREVLTKFGFSPCVPQRLESIIVSVLAPFAALSLAVWVWLQRSSLDIPGSANAATALAALGAFFFGYRQWRSSRYEKSMEDFYSRLNLANQRRENTELVCRLLRHTWELKGVREAPPSLCECDDHQWSMYVYAELDNLEYVVEKYNLGYMQPRHALRGLRTFYERCLRQCFRDRAWRCVRFYAYNDSTIQVVEKVCQHIEERRTQPRPPRSQGPGSVLPWPLDKAAL